MILLIKLSNERIKLVSLNLNPDSEILLSLLNPHAQILPPLPHPPGRPLVPHHYHFLLFLLSFTLFFLFAGFQFQVLECMHSIQVLCLGFCILFFIQNLALSMCFSLLTMNLYIIFFVCLCACCGYTSCRSKTTTSSDSACV